MEFPLKSEVESIVKSHKSNFCKILSIKYPIFYGWVSEQPYTTKSETLYNWLYEPKTKCLNCEKPTQFVSVHLGYREFCSNACVNISKLIRDRTVTTFLNKYGTTNVSQNEDVKIKKRDTCRKRYGVDCPFNSVDVKLKAKNGRIARFGSNNMFVVKSVRDKIQTTKLDNFYDICVNGDRLSNCELITPKSEFVGIDTVNLQFKCKQCAHVFNSYLKYGNDPICPLCNISTFHKEVWDYLKSIIKQDRITINRRDIIENRELDILISDANLAIECNGNYWHSQKSGNKLPYYHLQKTEHCQKLGIRLIHIFEDEWVNKKDIVKAKLRNILHLNPESVFARKCTISEIDSKTSTTFLESHHIQGRDKSPIRLGLFNGTDLLAVMTFGGLRKCLGQTSEPTVFELCRYATKCQVVGGASKLFKYFTKHYVPTKVITYADRRWTGFGENLYDKIGFTKTGVTKCNYWYLNGINRIHRYKFAKHRLSELLLDFDPNLSEWENMQNNGYDRIWDCGSLKYRWKS